MFLLKKSISFVAILACLPAASAATARPSVLGNAARRMPTMSTYVTGTTTSTTTMSNLLANAECIDAYTSCIKGADACGSGFEECTTKVLFHAKMPQCLSTLAQCSASGITSLFGTSNTTALSNVASKNTYLVRAAGQQIATKCRYARTRPYGHNIYLCMGGLAPRFDHCHFLAIA